MVLADYAHNDYLQAAAERIKNHYNWDDVVGKTEELMKKLDRR